MANVRSISLYEILQWFITTDASIYYVPGIRQRLASGSGGMLSLCAGCYRELNS